MNDKIDESMKKIMDLKKVDFDNYQPETMADAVAHKLVKLAIEDGGIQAIKLVTERTAGRVGVADKREKSDADIKLDKLLKLFGDKK